MTTKITKQEKKIINFIEKISKKKINSRTKLISSGLIDSLLLFELISFLEKKFHINLNESVITKKNFEYISSIVKLINK